MEASRPHFSQLGISLPGFSGSVLDSPLGDLWPLYLSASAGKSAASLNADGVAWRRLVKFADDCRIKDLTRQTARDWLLELASSRLESATRLAYLASCRRIWRLVESHHPELGGKMSPLHGGAGSIVASEAGSEALDAPPPRTAGAMSTMEEVHRLLEAQSKASGGAPPRLSELWAMYELIKGPGFGSDEILRDFERATWSEVVELMDDCPALALSVEHLAIWGRGKGRREALRACRRVWFASERHYGLGDGRKLFGKKDLQAAAKGSSQAASGASC